MKYLVDGHNLLFTGAGPWSSQTGRPLPEAPRILVETVEAFCRRRRARALIIFDGHVPRGFPIPPPAGECVEVRFSGSGASADDLMGAIVDEAPEGTVSWTVVSSDRDVRARARWESQKLLSAEAFADLIRDSSPPPRSAGPRARHRTLTPAEVDAWLKEFGFS